MNKLSTLCALALFSSAAVGQTIFMPPSGATADPSFSVNIFQAALVHHQVIYDTTLFTGAGIFSPIQINTLEFRQAATVGSEFGFAQMYSSVDFWLQRAAVDFASQSTTYATNRTVAFPTTPNFSGVVTRVVASGTAPVNDYVITVTLTTPFIYDPSLGQDLLVEFQVNAAPTPVVTVSNQHAIVCTNNIAASKCSTLRVVGATVPTALTGAISVFAPSMRLGYTVPPGIAKHDPYGTGCYTVARSFNEQFPSVSNDLSNSTVLAAQNLTGGYTAFTIPGSTITMPTGTGLALADDVVSAPIPLPFTFHYAGGSTNQIYVDSNGSILLNGTAASNIGGSGAALLASTVHRIAASMQDLLPDGALNVANVFAEADPANPTSVFLITWVNVPCYNTTPAPVPATSTFQIALIDSGTNDTFELRYATLTNDSDSNLGVAVTGFSLGGTALNGGSQDISATVINTSTDLGPLTLFGSPRPVLGTPVNYTLSNVRANLGISTMLASFGSIPGGLGLPAIGVAAPGCSAYIDPINNVGFGPLLFGAPTAGFAQTWPTGPWAGVLIFVQGFELAPLENAAGVLSSNGMKVELGIL